MYIASKELINNLVLVSVLLCLFLLKYFCAILDGDKENERVQERVSEKERRIKIFLYKLKIFNQF